MYNTFSYIFSRFGSIAFCVFAFISLLETGSLHPDPLEDMYAYMKPIFIILVAIFLKLCQIQLELKKPNG